MLGCWGGVLAAAVCPHVGCQKSPAAPEGAEAHGGHSPVDASESDGPADHCARAQASEARAAGPAAGEGQRPQSAASAGVVSAPHAPSCTHCARRPEAPPSTKFDRLSDPAGKAGKDSAPHVSGQLPPPPRLFVREVTPSRRAPPGGPERHLLLGVFRI